MLAFYLFLFFPISGRCGTNQLCVRYSRPLKKAPTLRVSGFPCGFALKAQNGNTPQQTDHTHITVGISEPEFPFGGGVVLFGYAYIHTHTHTHLSLSLSLLPGLVACENKVLPALWLDLQRLTLCDMTPFSFATASSSRSAFFACTFFGVLFCHFWVHPSSGTFVTRQVVVVLNSYSSNLAEYVAQLFPGGPVTKPGVPKELRLGFPVGRWGQGEGRFFGLVVLCLCCFVFFGGGTGSHCFEHPFEHPFGTRPKRRCLQKLCFLGCQC